MVRRAFKAYVGGATLEAIGREIGKGPSGVRALLAAVFGAVAGFLREADESGDLNRRMERWVKARLRAGGAATVEARWKDRATRKARLVRAAEETDDPDVSARIRALNAELAGLDATGAPDARAVKAEAADMLRRTREAARQEAATPEAASRSLVAVRPLLAAVIFDRDTRTVEVNFSPWHHETKIGLVPRAGRAKQRQHSGSSAPWRVRA